jgi:hypothetical protein
MIKIENVLFISLGGALGYFTRVLIEHYLAKSRTREDRKEVQRANAVAAFRNTLITELSGLHPEVTEALNLIAPRLSDAIPKIQTAVSLFAGVLSNREAQELQSSFNLFRDAAQNEIPRLCSRAEIMFGKESVSKAFTLLRERIEGLLAHAV